MYQLRGHRKIIGEKAKVNLVIAIAHVPLTVGQWLPCSDMLGKKVAQKKLFVKTSSGASYTDPVISSLALEAKTLTMVTIMKALKEIVEEESLHIVTKSGAQTRL